MLVTVLVQAIVLLIAGRLIFGIQWGRLEAVVLLTLVAAGVAGGLALLVISFAQDAGAGGRHRLRHLPGPRAAGRQLHRHAQTSGDVRAVQKFTPNGWLIEGWDQAMRGGGAGDIRWQVLVPLGFAVAFFFFAVLRMRRRFS